jgi:hypothetical protein
MCLTRSTDALACVLVEHMDACVSEIDPDRGAIPPVEGLVRLDLIVPASTRQVTSAWSPISSVA